MAEGISEFPPNSGTSLKHPHVSPFINHAGVAASDT
jgi:hypothetical protein